MNENPFDQNEIYFWEEDHLYFEKSTGQRLFSVSQILNNYKPKFDPDGHIKRAVARRDGLSVEEVSENWGKAKNDGLIRGKNFHRQVEHFINTGKILDEDYKDVVKLFSKIKFSGKLFSEILLFSLKYYIAGTADLICLLNNKECELFDFKSNKKIDLKSKYNKKLLYPLDQYDDCEINIYTFQLGLYKYMLEERGLKVKKITLYHINPQTRKIDSYNISDVKNDIIKMLNHYNKNK